ncbi:hypothetical protein COCSUDRAFT_63777 [Coccomyxa subellipsoidea C-169]|uniref:Uncharacterized protein n=1 Tax=Coccomyxa subellipsoidea (strain C-169) TaxID=574566 RepID=I0YW65_COCSC|nr:hypothetical protein COCSUDRAFT_63777 [Coccomyxa subellipsoidea C-169]EIE22634.1 hypothetical protein COCSUDRAFT_63777 [Coccomyxa subellipsoidea C-169]|eukprot:XP_005647178.1 hypothetical protein COCSUDRAFT_63777 [Coccomyxa subellipsoidea C-169]
MIKKTLVIGVENTKECLKAVDFAIEHFPTGYVYHVLHVQSRPLATSIVASAAAAEFAYENTEAIGKEMVAASGHFMHEVFAPRAQSAGAEVLAVVETSNGNSGAVIFRPEDDM